MRLDQLLYGLLKRSGPANAEVRSIEFNSREVRAQLSSNPANQLLKAQVNKLQPAHLR